MSRIVVPAGSGFRGRALVPRADFVYALEHLRQRADGSVDAAVQLIQHDREA